MIVQRGETGIILKEAHHITVNWRQCLLNRQVLFVKVLCSFLNQSNFFPFFFWIWFFSMLQWLFISEPPVMLLFSNNPSSRYFLSTFLFNGIFYVSKFVTKIVIWNLFASFPLFWKKEEISFMPIMLYLFQIEVCVYGVVYKSELMEVIVLCLDLVRVSMKWEWEFS